MSRRRLALVLAVVVCLASVYMVTFSGRIESGDALYLFDGVSSLVDFGDFRLDVSAGTRLPQRYNTNDPNPLPTANNEPMQMVLGAGLYALARALPDIGLVHAVYLLNILVCSGTAGVLLLYALALGYRERTAVLTALVFGVATIVWPYSKSFFREPLTMFLLLLTGLLAERWRVSGYRSVPLLIAMLAALSAMLLTKATATLGLPGLLLVALPTLRGMNRRVFIGISIAVLVGAVLFAIFVLFGEELGVGERYNLLDRLVPSGRSDFRKALHTYLLSVGGSIWATSPIVVLALPGLYMLARRRSIRYAAVILVVVLAYAFGHAAYSGRLWFGGLSWPPRFLVPVVPYLMLATVPLIDRLTGSRPPRWLTGAFALLMLASLWVQFSGVSLQWGDYLTGLPERAQTIEWHGGLNEIEFLRPVVIPQLWGKVPFDVIWARIDLLLWPVSFMLLAAIAGLVLPWLLGWQTHVVARRGLLTTLLLPVSFVALTFVLLQAANRDPLYLPDRPGLRPMLDVLRAETGPDDVVLLSNREHERFFDQFGKLDGARVIGLGDQPGDQPSELQLPRVVSNNPQVLIDNLALPFLHALAANHDRIWLLENKGPAFDWAVRPVEQLMATHYYPLRLLTTEPPDPTVRLLEYATVSAPDPYRYQNPEVLADFTFGETFELVGLTLPLGTQYVGGDVLPVSFMWRGIAPLDADYRIAWFVRDATGAPVVQAMDSRPRGDFERTSTWTPAESHWDNRALVLPEGLAAGEYQLWVKVYRFDETLTAVDLPAKGSEVLDGVIAILPVRVHIG